MEEDLHTTEQRYYPSRNEQAVLITGLQQYFSLPERSKNRSLLVTQITTFLSQISPHWDHRKVRLWMNNNKRTYFNPNKKAPVLFPPSIPHPPPPAPPHLPCPPISHIPQYVTPINQHPIIPPPIIAQPITGAPPKPKHQLTIVKPLEPENPASLYRRLGEILKLIRSSGRADLVLVDEFDQKCQKIAALSGFCQPEKIDPENTFVTFPELSTSSFFPFIDTSLTHLDSIGDIQPFTSTPFFPSDIPQKVWTDRQNRTIPLPSFESAALSTEYYAVSYLSKEPGNREIEVARVDCEGPPVIQHTIPSSAPIECMSLGNGSLWTFSSGTLHRFSIQSVNENPVQSINLMQKYGTAKLTTLPGGKAAVTFPTSRLVSIVSADMDLNTIEVPYEGILTMENIGPNFILGLVKSYTPRLFSDEFQEIRAFPGHTGDILDFFVLSDTLFASRSDDKTVGIWDIRNVSPIAVLGSGRAVIQTVTGTQDFIICSFSNKGIGVFDMRAHSVKPFFGIQTDEYACDVINYSEAEDKLTAIGIAEKDLTQSSIDIIDNRFHSMRKVIKIYDKFINSSGI